ncbi:MAG: CapA family protein [Bilifractor sp.]
MEKKDIHSRTGNAEEPENKGKQPRHLTASEQVDLEEEIREIAQDEQEGLEELKRRRERREQRRREEEERRVKLRKNAVRAAAGAAAAVAVIGIAVGVRAAWKRSSTSSGQDAAAGVTDASASGQESVAGTSGAVSAGSGNTATDQKDSMDVRFSAAGDNLVSERMLTQAKERSGDGASYDFSYLYAGVSSFLQEHEVNWIDVETDINNEITPAGYPEFSTPGQDGIDLYHAGFNIFSLANNHIYDLGTDGIAAALNFWQNDMPSDAKFLTTGLWKKDTDGSTSYTAGYSDAGLTAQFEVKYDDIPIYTCANGKTIAFLTYTQMTNEIDGRTMYETPSDAEERVIYLYETDLIKAQIQKADEKADAVVVACHWGDEDSHEVTDFQKETAQNLADWGADLIVGDHAHVVQPAEMLTASDGRKVFCAYCLGNFVSTQEQPDELIGTMLDCTFRFREDGADASEPEVTVIDPKLVPIVTDYGEDGADAHVVLLKDYSDEQAKANGINGYITDGTVFDLDYIKSVLRSSIDSRYLDLSN